MTDPVTRYRNTYDEFSSLLGYAISLMETQTGHLAPGDREFYAERIFGKLVCHGISLKRLSPSPQPTNTPEIWDVSSNYAIARALIETYEALAYVALEPVEDDEREFRIALWKLHAEERRSEMLRLIGSKSPEVARIDTSLSELRSAVLNHPFIGTAGIALTRKVERNDAPPYHLSRAERDRRTGIDWDYHTAVTMHLSSHVHTHPFSIHQLFEFKAGEPESLRLMSISLQYSAAFLAKSISGMIEVFAPRVPPTTPELLRALDIWEGVLRNGVKSVG